MNTVINKSLKLLLDQTSNEQNIAKIAQQTKEIMGNEAFFCLQLKGEMGSGKTTFTRFLLQQFGLNPNWPVTSPTYSLVNEYEINKKWYAHADLYRLEENSDIEDLFAYRKYAGLIVEWLERCPNQQILKANYILEIEKTSDESRRYRLCKA